VSTTDDQLKITGGTVTFAAVNGSYILYPLLVSLSPGGTTSLTFSSNALLSVPGRPFNVTSTRSGVKATLRDCIANEEWTDTDTCKPCSAGTLNIFPMDQSVECVDCPTTAFCLGGQYVGP
jgi:hypothetical protein